MSEKAIFDTANSKKVFRKGFKQLVKDGKNEKVQKIVQDLAFDGHLPNVAVDSNGETLLHLAVEYDNVHLINFFLDMGCYPNAKTLKEGMTPLLLAIQKGHVKSVEALLVASAHANFLIIDAERVLRAIISMKETFTVSLLTTLMQKLKDSQGDLEALFELFQRVQCPLKLIVYVNEPGLTRLFTQNPRYDIENNDYVETLIHVIKVKDLKHLRLLCDFERNADQLLRYKQVFTNFALWIDNTLADSSDLIALFKSSSDWLYEDSNCAALITHSIFLSAEKIATIRILLEECGIDIQMMQRFQINILPILCGNQKLNTEELSEILVKSKVFHVNAFNMDGMTALHCAAINGASNKIGWLVEGMHADVNALDIVGKTPLAYAQDPKCAELLLQNGADLQFADTFHKLVFEQGFDINSPWEVAVAQFAIDLKRSGHIHESFLRSINSVQILKEHFESCLMQVDLLINREFDLTGDKVNPHITTMFDIVKANSTNIQTAIATTLEWLTKQKIHSYYRSLMKAKLDKAYDLYKSESQAAAAAQTS